MDKPRFYLTEQEAKKAFITEYVFDVKLWENMDDDEIEKWYDLTHGKMSEFPAYSYDVDEQPSGNESSEADESGKHFADDV